ncbi:MAG: peptidyl-prolyl cis-trans isomerase [Candidatus Babeliales bacterium]
MNVKQSLSLSVAVFALLALAGCADSCKHDDGHGHSADNDVLLRINGKPAVTVAEFEEYKAKILEIQPQYKQMMAMMPEPERVKIDQNLYENMVNQKVLQAWVEKNNINDSAEYQKDLALIVDFAKQNLSVKHFQEKHPVTVTEADLLAFYEDNKGKMPGLSQSLGGVHAKAVKFESRDKANDFLAKAKAPGADFDKLAKASNLKVEEYKDVNNRSFNLDMQVRKSLLAMESLPRTELVEAGKTAWVVKGIEKTEAVYVAFDEVREGLENMLKQQKQTEIIQAELEKLKKEYDVDINSGYFDAKIKLAQEAVQQEAEKLAAAQEADKEVAVAQSDVKAEEVAPAAKAA